MAKGGSVGKALSNSIHSTTSSRPLTFSYYSLSLHILSSLSLFPFLSLPFRGLLFYTTLLPLVSRPSTGILSRVDPFLTLSTSLLETSPLALPPRHIIPSPCPSHPASSPSTQQPPRCSCPSRPLSRSALTLHHSTSAVSTTRRCWS